MRWKMINTEIVIFLNLKYKIFMNVYTIKNLK